tara:strand:+ start:388 stop:762 length:375 start_codon:yes stop_codon:yes gene_type:complete
MQLHNNSGNIIVIIDVSFDDRDMFMDFILNEQCQFIDSVDPKGLIKFEWFLDEDSNTGTLVEVFEKSDNFQELAGKVMGTPVNLKFREITNIEKMTVLGDVSDELMENLAPMNPISKKYKGGLS